MKKLQKIEENGMSYMERYWAISIKRGIASLGSSFDNNESRSLFVDLLNTCLRIVSYVF